MKKGIVGAEPIGDASRTDTVLVISVIFNQ